MEIVLIISISVFALSLYSLINWINYARYERTVKNLLLAMDNTPFDYELCIHCYTEEWAEFETAMVIKNSYNLYF